MKYLCMIYEDETVWQTMPKADREKLYAEYSAFKDDITKTGHLLGCNPLQPTHTATIVRVRGRGKVSTTPWSLRRDERATRRVLSLSRPGTSTTPFKWPRGYRRRGLAASR